MAFFIHRQAEAVATIRTEDATTSAIHTELPSGTAVRTARLLLFSRSSAAVPDWENVLTGMVSISWKATQAEEVKKLHNATK